MLSSLLFAPAILLMAWASHTATMILCVNSPFLHGQRWGGLVSSFIGFIVGLAVFIHLRDLLPALL